MKKFGFGKKGDKKESASQASAASNPYTQSQALADPYLQDVNNQESAPSYAVRQNNGIPNRPDTAQSGRPAPSNSNSRYSADKYGSGSGYGANRYDTSGSSDGLDSKYGASGYGGMRRRNSNETVGTEENRNALFGAAKDRYAQRGSPYSSGAGGGYGVDTSGGLPPYGGGYGEDRQLTQEEQEEEEVAATKEEIRLMKREDVSSTQRALEIAAQAEETGRATLARLGAQSERLYNTEKNLDLVANSNRKAEEKAKELKTLNRSMFAVHVSNPFTSSARRAARDEEIQTKHQQEREQREATRQAAFNSRQRLEGNMRDIENGENGYRPQTKASLAERSRFQFEADSEDEEMENQIDKNLDALGHAAGRLNALARATGKEVEEQNKHIDRIMGKSDRVDDQINMNRARLERIK